MAKASFEYDINSRDKTAKGTKSAEKNITSVGKTAQKTSKMIKAAFATVSFAAVIKGIGEVNKAFEEQQLVEQRLAAAAKNNPLLDGTSVNNMKKYAAALQSASTFGDEAIIQQQAFLASMGQSEEQINQTLQAAVDLASTGVVSLDSAVKNLAKTSGGLAGELGELIPEMKDLTAEQLKAGAGIDLVAEKYAGMAQSVADTNQGIKTQMKNTFGDVLETIGGIFDAAGGDLLRKLQPHLNSLNEWLAQNTDSIATFFKNLPQIAGASLKFVKDLFLSMWNLDFIKAIGGSIWDYFKDAAQNTIKTVWSFLVAIGTTIWEPLKLGFQWVIYGIKIGFEGMINGIITSLNFVAKMAHDAVQLLLHPLSKKKRTAFGGGIGMVDVGAEKPGGLDTDDITDAWKEFGSDFGKNLTAQLDALKTLGADIGEDIATNTEFNNLFTELKTTFSDLIIPLEKVADNTKETEKTITETFRNGGRDFAGRIGIATAGEITRQGAGTGGFRGGRAGILDSGMPGGTDSGSMIGAILKMIWGDVTEGITEFTIALGESLKGVEAVAMLMDSMATVIAQVVDILGPALNNVLAPLVGILGVLGNVIGAMLVPVLEALSPVIELIGQAFVWLHNKILKPVANAIIVTFNIMKNVIIGLANVFRGIANEFRTDANKKAMFALGDIGAGKLEDISYAGDIVPTGTDAISSSGGTFGAGGGGASYTAGRTINQTVIINTDVIAGGDGIRGLALLIRDEIKSAERLGA